MLKSLKNKNIKNIVFIFIHSYLYLSKNYCNLLYRKNQKAPVILNIKNKLEKNIIFKYIYKRTKKVL